ncbi:MAG: DUF1080 domain-containing protein [Mariniphaga sp.]|nr:DUF1080 domain-containing protein [Mariniphaga sp.]
MKYLTYIAMSIFLFTASGCASNDSEINILTKKEIKQGWELLFDGKSVDNWKSFNGGEVTGWKIIDGILHNSGVGSDHGGDIITKKKYANFELYLEWKVAPESNSGIFYRVQEGLVNAIYESGPEYQLIDDKGWPTKLKDSQYSGANYDMHPPQNAQVVPIEEWNRTKIIVHGSHVEHWLNDKKVVEYELWTDDWQERKANSKWKNMPHYGAAQSGHIGIQDHGGLTMFRNIKIRKL